MSEIDANTPLFLAKKPQAGEASSIQLPRSLHGDAVSRSIGPRDITSGRNMVGSMMSQSAKTPWN